MSIDVVMDGDNCRTDLAGKCGVATLETIARLPAATPSGASVVMMFVRVDGPQGEAAYLAVEMGMQAFIDAARAMAQIESIAFEQKVLSAAMPGRLN